jgi:multidrug efflux pump subunit AcrA (membrane-fusion protein)
VKSKIKKHKKKIIIISIIAILVIAGIIVGVKLLKKDGLDKKVKKQSTVSLTKQDLVSSISATGTIESKKTKSVSAQMENATVKSVKVSVGDTVEKGDVLVVFDKSDLQDALDDAKENLSDVKTENSKQISKAKSQLSEAKTNYSEQNEEMALKVTKAKKALTEAKEAVAEAKKSAKSDKRNTNEQKLEQAQSEYDSAVSEKKSTNKQNQSNIDTAEESVDTATDNYNKNVKEARKQVETAQENLDKCSVTAPMAGVVSAINVEAGDQYSNGTIAQIDDINSFTVTTSVDEYDISNVKKGQRVVIKTEATDDDELEGVITYVALSTNSSTAASGMSTSSSSSGYEVKIRIKTSDDRLRMGLTAKCSIVLEESKDVFAVPYDAVHDLPDGTSVIYVANNSDNQTESTASSEDNAGNNQEIMNNKDNSDSDNGNDYTQVVVTKGMETDYYIAISGDDLYEGMQVIVPTDEVSEASDSEDESSMLGGFGGMNGGDMPGNGAGGGDKGGGDRGGNGGGMPGM